jgi:hypothetical protein
MEIWARSFGKDATAEKETHESIADFRSWHFWLFALVHQRWCDQDLLPRGLVVDVVASIGNLPLLRGLSRAYSLAIGPRSVALLIASQDLCVHRSRLFFCRSREEVCCAPQSTQAMPSTQTHQAVRQSFLRHRKRQKLGDMLNLFTADQ